MKVSVLIPTLGRREVLIRTVEALATSQTRVPDEIVVVDQNQPPIPEVDAALAAFPIVRHVRGSSPGVAINYNRCLREAQGEIVLFVDDDIVPDSRLVERHLTSYDDPAIPGIAPIGGVAGRVEQPSGDPDPKTIEVWGRYHRLSGTITTRFNSVKRGDVDIAPGGNMSFRRQLLLNCDGFDQGFSGNGYFFETDGSLRVKALGYRLVFEPQATLKHLAAPSGGARIVDKALHTYYFVRNGMRLFRRHSPIWVQPWLLARMLVYVVLKAAYNRSPRLLFHGLRGWLVGALQSMRVRGLRETPS